ncbi:M10 family metallopeptidase C-terminal domain-containing protein [Chelativorans salis]|uniref:M10 family metallopeptidase C-terminal domain-containing protein n=1 Tax=Chelativorans salis TaxID=2978478 RepID=A0ABT2LKP4_9HYPH|nr:M10 family metallopeptidase C-terminal domain-containing protein [Chelativorans sp. EGI FJ00035]MCT7375172.1 M10 family metallopeptidase C-terminal domain-containing protein [Chelativorans sp. EGI FJ00035]
MDFEETQPLSEQSLKTMVNFITTGYWEYAGKLKSISHDPQERKDTNYIDGQPREEKDFTYQLNGFSQEREERVEAALQLWEDVVDIRFTKIGNDVGSDRQPNIKFRGDSDPHSQNAGWADGFAWGAATVDVPDNSSDFDEHRARLWMSDDELRATYGFGDEEIKEVRKLDEKTIDIVAETLDFTAIVHEIGHALGLGHPGYYNGRMGAETGSVFEHDKSHIAIMSYVHLLQEDLTQLVPVTPQMADIQAIQTLYGAAETRTGNTIYGFGINADDFPNTDKIYDLSKYGNLVSFTIYDSGGVDVLDVSGFNDDQFIDLRGGAFSNVGGKKANIGIYMDTVIEYAKGGGGDDQIVGNDGSNALYGNDGSDALYGRGSGDTLFGDGSVWSFVGGNDTLDGGGGNDLLYGMAGGDELIGGDGDDRLLGFIGDDVLEGGAGADRFIFELHQNSPVSCWGNDVIKDFKDGDDTIVFAGSAAPTSIDELEIDPWSEGGARITYDGNSIALKGYYATPDSSDFVFENATGIA